MAGKAFNDFQELHDETKKVLASLGFERATPVQEATIPLFAGNKDVAVDACTGSGKTLAFVIPIVEKLRRLDHQLKRHQVGAIIVSPTRELARQIFTVAEPFVGTVPWLRSALLVGGSDPSVDVAALKSDGGHVLVGTPGRLDDVLQRCPFLDLKTLEVLVLDEADRLLDMGFRQQLDAIMARLPRQRRTGLFSATQTEAVEALARAGLRNPVRVAVAVSYAPNSGAGEASADTRKKAGKKTKDGDANGSKAEAGVKAPGYEQVTPSTLSVQYTAVDVAGKVAQLASFLAAHVHEKVIVYFLTCACVDYFATVLPRLAPCKAVPFRALHGRMKQSVREAALEAFASAHAGVLLCTDVAARGLDIPDVHWVVQYDAPQDPSAFVHRCGRTARMGRSGSALAYLTPEEVPYVDFLRLRKVPLEEVPPVPDLIPDVLRVLRSESESDRAVMESGTKAFVSYIRAYKEHHCKYIFRMESLRVGQLASSFALLRLPRMQELKKAAREAASGKLEGFAPSLVDPETVKFRDKAKEKQRQAVLKQRAAAVAAAAVEAGEAANGAHAAAATAAAQQRKQRQGAQEQPRLTANKRRQLEARQELAELNEEYTLLKKLKKGKISAREYDAATGASSDDEGPGPRGQGAKDGAGVKDRGHGAGQAPGEGLLGVNLVAAALKKKSRKAKKKKSRAMKREAGLGGATEG